MVDVGKHLLDDAPHPLAVLRGGAVQDVVSELDFDYAGYRDEHFERLLAALRAPEFERSLADAAAP